MLALWAGLATLAHAHGVMWHLGLEHKLMKKHFIFVILIIASCSKPLVEDVKREFLNAHPEATIVSVAPGEGDSAVVYMHIKYQLPNSDIQHEAIWQYLNNDKNKWSVANKKYVSK